MNAAWLAGRMADTVALSCQTEILIYGPPLLLLFFPLSPETEGGRRRRRNEPSLPSCVPRSSLACPSSQSRILPLVNPTVRRLDPLAPPEMKSDTKDPDGRASYTEVKLAYRLFPPSCLPAFPSFSNSTIFVPTTQGHASQRSRSRPSGLHTACRDQERPFLLLYLALACPCMSESYFLPVLSPSLSPSFSARQKSQGSSVGPSVAT